MDLPKSSEMSHFIDNQTAYPYLSIKHNVSTIMGKPFQYLTVKVVSNSVLENGNFVAVVEFYDGSKAIIPSIESVKVNDLVLVSRELVAINNNPFSTADQIVRVLTNEEKKVFDTLKETQEKAIAKQKEQEEKTSSYVG